MSLKKDPVSLFAFIKAVKNGKRNFFEILDTPSATFQTASFEEIMSNQSDVLSGVNKVLINFRNRYFNLYENCLVKYFDNQDIKFVFYTVTSQVADILAVADLLFQELGPGIYDDSKAYPFTRKDRIESLAQSNLYGKDIMHLWHVEDTSWLLQYKSIPLRQFSLMVTINHPKEYDFNVRSKGTILQHIDFDIASVLGGPELKVQKEFDGSDIKFVDYTYRLSRPIFEAFDRVKIRKFNAVKLFEPKVQTHVTFFSENSIDEMRKINVMEKLIRIYGKDISGMADLEIHEREIIENKEFYMGRTWRLNQSHALTDAKNITDREAYSLTVDDMKDGEGFKIHISSFNILVDLFAN